jgi:hypothetical protein
MLPRIRRATMANCGSMSVSTGPTVLMNAPLSLQSKTERELDQGRDHEGWNSAARSGGCDDGIVGSLVLPKRCGDPHQRAEEKCQRQSGCPELRGNRETLGEKLVHGEFRQVIAGAQIAVQKIVQVVEVLKDERLIEVKLLFQISLDGGIESPLLVEGAARRHPHQKERYSDDHKECWNCGEQPFQNVSQHQEIPRELCPASPAFSMPGTRSVGVLYSLRMKRVG